MDEKKIFYIQDYITTHLDEDLNLNKLAGMAALSPYHFHRLYRRITGETLYDFIQRLRLERACIMLSSNPGMKIIDIALQSGFNAPSSFSKAFRAQYNISPSEYRTDAFLKKSKNGLPGSNTEKDTISRMEYISEEKLVALYKRRKSMNVKVEKLPACRIAYMRNIGPYGEGNKLLMQKLKRWAITRDLLDEGSIILGIAQDDPNITPSEKCRYDTCIVVPDDYNLGSEVNEGRLPGGAYGILKIAHTAEAIKTAWIEIFSQWMPGSGYQIDDRPLFERYIGASIEAKIEPASCEICIPVRPL